MFANHPDGAEAGRALMVAYRRALWLTYQADQAIDHAAELIADAVSGMSETCALDAADKGPLTHRDVSRLFGLTVNRIYKSEREALQVIRGSHMLVRFTRRGKR